MARPLVTTPTGANGIPIEAEHAFVREREEGFADSVVSLLGNPDDRDAIGQRAMNFVRKRFAWGAVTGETVNEILV